MEMGYREREGKKSKAALEEYSAETSAAAPYLQRFWPGNGRPGDDLLFWSMYVYIAVRRTRTGNKHDPGFGEMTRKPLLAAQ